MENAANRIGGSAWCVALCVSLLVAVAPACLRGPAVDPAEEALRIERGRRIVEGVCILCHSVSERDWGKPSNLVDCLWRNGGDVGSLRATISSGVPGTTMRPFANDFDAETIDSIIAFIRSRNRCDETASPAAPPGPRGDPSCSPSEGRSACPQSSSRT